jgi:hypothetical protein
MKSIFVAAIIAATCSSVALAGELKQDQNAPAVKAQVMSDSEMDKVAAGDGAITDPGFGKLTSCDARGLTCKIPPTGLPGFGRLTAAGH